MNRFLLLCSVTRACRGECPGRSNRSSSQGVRSIGTTQRTELPAMVIGSVGYVCWVWQIWAGCLALNLKTCYLRRRLILIMTKNLSIVGMWWHRTGKHIHTLPKEYLGVNTNVVKTVRLNVFKSIYYYIRNFCKLIGLEQWYFSLIWNTYLWKLRNVCR